MTQPVTPERIQIAKDFGLRNVDVAAAVCRDVAFPFWAACALLEQESGGRNVYGHDAGGVRPTNVPTDRNFLGFLVKVMNGATSNGVGPCQITWAGKDTGGHRDGGYFREMAEQGLRPWVPADNMTFGFTLLRDHRREHDTWLAAAKAYNSRPEYAPDLVAKFNEWRKRFGMSRTVK